MENKNIDKSTQFFFYQTDDGNIKIQVIADSENETLWATQASMAEIVYAKTNHNAENIG